MEYSQLTRVLSRIQGCTFASMDTETRPHEAPGLIKQVTGMNVLLFSNKKSNGYENMVRRRLEEAGKDPDSFVLHPLPWGERVPGTPVIQHRGFFYLQVIPLHPGEIRCFIDGGKIRKEVNPKDWLSPSKYDENQDLDDRQVHVRTFNLEHVKRIKLLGMTVEGEVKKAKPLLRIR